MKNEVSQDISSKQLHACRNLMTHRSFIHQRGILVNRQSEFVLLCVFWERNQYSAAEASDFAMATRRLVPRRSAPAARKASASATEEIPPAALMSR